MLARYMKVLSESAGVSASGIWNIAPILSEIPQDRINQMGVEAEMEEFRTAWAALQESRRVAVELQAGPSRRNDEPQSS